jgi:DNA-directed RNA polymerase specialized sigma24 family protein
VEEASAVEPEECLVPLPPGERLLEAVPGPAAHGDGLDVHDLAHLDALGERVKNVFILFRLEGRKQKDIAALYGISVSTVEKHIMAATLHLA